MRLKRSLVPAAIALLDSVNDFWPFHVVHALSEPKEPDALRERVRSCDKVARELPIDADMVACCELFASAGSRPEAYRADCGLLGISEAFAA